MAIVLVYLIDTVNWYFIAAWGVGYGELTTAALPGSSTGRLRLLVMGGKWRDTSTSPVNKLTSFSLPPRSPTQVVLIPTWILLILFLISIIVYSCVRCCMFKLEENPQEVKVRRPLVTILIVCLFVIAFSFLLFLVSSFHPDPVIWMGGWSWPDWSLWNLEYWRPLPHACL